MVKRDKLISGCPSFSSITLNCTLRWKVQLGKEALRSAENMFANDIDHVQ
jgi:hypothetical protein